MSDAPLPPGDARARKQTAEIPWKLVLWVAIAVYALVFLLLNDDKQSVSFVFFTVNTRLPWLILLSMALGRRSRSSALAGGAAGGGSGSGAYSRPARMRTPSAIRSGVS